MAVTHGGSADTLVVFVFHGTEGQLHILAVFGNLLEYRFVFFMVGNAPDHQRDVDGTQHLLDRCGCIRGAGIVAIGIGALELEYDNFGAVFLNAFFCPCGRVGDHVLERFHCRCRPLIGYHVPDLHGYFRFVGHFALKLIEWIAGFAANSNGFVAFTDGDRLYRPCIGFLIEFETQSLPPYQLPVND